jgi:hypothetical protein
MIANRQTGIFIAVKPPRGIANSSLADQCEPYHAFPRMLRRTFPGGARDRLRSIASPQRFRLRLIRLEQRRRFNGTRPRAAQTKGTVMSQQGTIALIDREQSAAAISTEHGYTVVEIDPDWPLEVGDRIEWDETDGLGFQEYRNLSKNALGEVFVQNHELDEKSLRLQFGF